MTETAYYGIEFEKLGFTPTSFTMSGDPVLLTNEEYPDIRIRVDPKEKSFQVCGGSTKFFGEVRFEIVYGSPSDFDLEVILDAMKHYVNIINNNHPW